MDPSSIILDTIEFASEKHKNQRRKDIDATPYINHPIAVANLISKVGQVNDVAILQGALLHDTVEDTATSYEEIEQRFGKTVADYVAEVTDNKSLPKDERKRQQVSRGPYKSVGAKTIKLADKLNNLTSLIETTPKSWTVERIQGYYIWSFFVIEGLRGTNAALEAELDKIFNSHFYFESSKYPCLPTTDRDEMTIKLNEYYESMAKKDD